MSVSMKDALYIYDALSKMINRDGHTYVLLGELKRQNTKVTTWKESLAYLKTIDVVGTSEDHLGDMRHVFLTHIRGFEENIARNLATMMGNKPWLGNITIDEQVRLNTLQAFIFGYFNTSVLRCLLLIFRLNSKDFVLCIIVS